MACVTLQGSQKTISDPKELSEFLAFHGVTYQRWFIPANVAALCQKPELTEADTDQIAAAFETELSVLKSAGYLRHDMLCLSPQTPQLPALLARFEREHFHTDDEARVVLAGRGIFCFESRRRGSRFTIELHPGDFITIPANHWHTFTVGPERSIKTLRVFQEVAGWIPYYRAAELPAVSRRAS